MTWHLWSLTCIFDRQWLGLINSKLLPGNNWLNDANKCSCIKIIPQAIFPVTFFSLPIEMDRKSLTSLCKTAFHSEFSICADFLNNGLQNLLWIIVYFASCRAEVFSIYIYDLRFLKKRKVQETRKEQNLHINTHTHMHLHLCQNISNNFSTFVFSYIRQLKQKSFIE